MLMMAMHTIIGRKAPGGVAPLCVETVMATGNQMQRQEKKNTQQKKRQGATSRKFYFREPPVA